MTGQIRHTGSRISGDRYYTSDKLASACVAAVHKLEPIASTATVLEPHVGGGAFARALLQQTSARVIVSDIDPNAPGLQPDSYTGRAPSTYLVGDFKEMGYIPPLCDGRWTFMNPPYSDAEGHVSHALKHSERVVALVRLAFLAGKGRAQRLHPHAPLRACWVLAGRPSFTVTGTGRYDYALLFYDKLHPPLWGQHLIAGWRWEDA